MLGRAGYTISIYLNPNSELIQAHFRRVYASFQPIAFVFALSLPNAVIPKIQITPGDLWQALDMQ